MTRVPGRWIAMLLPMARSQRAKRTIGGQGLESALALLDDLTQGSELREWIGSAERRLRGVDAVEVAPWLEAKMVTSDTLSAALLVKRRAGQINVLVHSIGILTALPYILEPGETIESLSLGAGNTGRAHDLATNRRIAEFKFTDWRGGPESIRQNGLFADLFSLASDPVEKRKVMYVVGKGIPLQFLQNRRALASVLSKNVALARRFHEAYGDKLITVGDYYELVKHEVEIVDLADVAPSLDYGRHLA